MKIADAYCPAKGYVNPSFVDICSGRRVPFKTRHNQLSYMSAEAMAAAFGGDPSYIPAKMGFIYGPSGYMSPSGISSPDADQSGSSDPFPIGTEISRRQSWADLTFELNNAKADVQVVDFSYSPSLGGEKSSSDPLESEGDYCNIKSTGSNAITFHAVSNSSDAGFSGAEAFRADDLIYQAVLLGYHEGKYYVISRVSLEDGGRYLRKPDGFEVALDWTIVFH